MPVRFLKTRLSQKSNRAYFNKVCISRYTKNMADTPDDIKKKKLQIILALLEKPETNRWELGHYDGFSKISISRTVPEAYLLKHILTDTLGFRCDYMPMEKVLWGIGFCFGGVLCKVTSEKFGHRLYIDSTDEKVLSEMSECLTSVFNDATAFLSSLLKGYASLEIQKGNITVNNHYGRMKAMYEYFKQESLKQIEAPSSEAVGKKGAGELVEI